MKPNAPRVDVENCVFTSRYTVLVVARLIRTDPVGIATGAPATWLGYRIAIAPPAGCAGIVAETWPIAAITSIVMVDPPGTVTTFPCTSQSPAVSEIEVTLAGVTVVSPTAAPPNTVDEIYSPMYPALELSLVAVPLPTN